MKAAKSMSDMAHCELDEKARRTTPKASADCNAIADIETRLTVKGSSAAQIAAVGMRKDAIIKCNKANYSAQAFACMKAAKNLVAFLGCEVDDKRRKQNK